jgi:hypothetical protein
MTNDAGGGAVEEGGASKPVRDQDDGQLDPAAGNAAAREEKPSPGNRGRSEASSPEETPPIDLDTAHDRAS